MVTRPCSRTRIRCRTVTTRVSGEAEARATVRAARKPPNVSAATRRSPAITLPSSRCRSSSSRQRSRVRIEGSTQRRFPAGETSNPERPLTRLPTEDANGPRRGSGPFVQEAACQDLRCRLRRRPQVQLPALSRFAFRRSIPGRTAPTCVVLMPCLGLVAGLWGAGQRSSGIRKIAASCSTVRMGFTWTNPSVTALRIAAAESD